MTDQPTEPDTEQDTDESVPEAADLEEAQEVEAEPATREAARYRTRLRETEQQRDDLATRVEALQRNHIDALLDREHITPAAFWALTDDLGGLLGDDGIPDPEKVKAAAQTAKEALGIDRGLYVPAEGRIPAATSGRKFTDAFTPPTNR